MAKKVLNPIFKEIEKQVTILIKDLSIHGKKKYGRKSSWRNFIVAEINYKGGRRLSSAHLNSILHKNKFKFLNCGGSRVALLYKNKYVIKIEKYESQFGSDNKNELKSYKNYIKHIPITKMCLLPIINSFVIDKSTFLVFPLVETLCEKMRKNGIGLFSNERKTGVLRRSGYIKTKYDFITSLFIDTHANNIGLFNGDIFYIDYNVESAAESILNHQKYNKLVGFKKGIKMSESNVMKMENMRFS